jgi:hypothetical protein
MALTYRFYRTTVIGTGVRGNAFRSTLSRYIVADGSGADFWIWVHWSRAIRYALACGESSVHAAIALDADIIALSEELSTIDEVEIWLQATAVSLPQATRNLFYDDGCPRAWMTGTTTRRELWQYWSELHSLIQRLKGSGQTPVMAVFEYPMQAVWASVPTDVQTAVTLFMTSQQMDTAWITAGTSVEAIVVAMMEQSGLPPLCLGPIRL